MVLQFWKSYTNTKLDGDKYGKEMGGGERWIRWGADYIRYKHSGIQNMGKGDLCKGVRFSWILQLKRDDRREKS